MLCGIVTVARRRSAEVAGAVLRIFAVTSFFVPVLHAQAQLDSLIALAMRNNPEIAMSQYDARAAASRVAPASRLPDPELKVAAMNVPTSLRLSSEEMTMAPQVTLMQMLPWFGKLGAAGEVSRYRYESSEDKAAAMRLEVVMKVKMAYGEIYRVEKSIRYLEIKKELLRSVVRVAEQLYAVGQVPQQDVFRATAELTMVESEIIDMQSMEERLQAELGALVGRSGPCTVRIDTLAPPPLGDPDSLAARAVGENPELRALRNGERGAEANAALMRKEAIPDLNLGVSYGYRGFRMPDGSKVSDMLSLELGVTLPIFYGSKQENAIEEADLMNRSAEEERNAGELALRSRLSSVYALASAKEKLIPLYTRQLIPQYEAAYNASLASYSVGKTTFAMLIDNLTMLINTRIELVKIESGYFSAVAELAMLAGEGSRVQRGAE